MDREKLLPSLPATAGVDVRKYLELGPCPKLASLAFVGTVFLTALSVQFWHRTEGGRGKGAHLAAQLPIAPGMWSSRELPLGETEAVRSSVEKTLRFEDWFYREYRSSRGLVSVYIAYWGPGKMPTQLVASHTPDRCWSSAGWNCEELKHHVPLVGLRAGEWRIFRAPNGELAYVQYWHMIGDEVYDYGERFNRVPSVWRWWRDAAMEALRPPAEQYFVRVSADQPFERFADDPGWQELIGALARLGLVAAPASTAK